MADGIIKLRIECSRCGHEFEISTDYDESEYLAYVKPHKCDCTACESKLVTDPLRVYNFKWN
jgi:transcription elongation factor Elf1